MDNKQKKSKCTQIYRVNLIFISGNITLFNYSFQKKISF